MRIALGLLFLTVLLVGVVEASEWVVAIGGDRSDYAYAIEQTSDGGYIIVGHTFSFGSDGDIWILKLDNEGNVEWQKSYGGIGQDNAFAIQQTSDGGYIVAGYTQSFGPGHNDVWILKLDSNGNIEWQKAYGGKFVDYVYAIEQTKDGGYIVAGETHSFGSRGDAWILKLDNNGNIQWQKAYGGKNNDGIRAIQQTKDGGYVVAGGTGSFGSGSYDAWILKLDSNGNIEWQKVYGGSNWDYVSTIQQTSDGGYIVAGITESFGSGQVDAWILKLDREGNIKWQRAYGGSSRDFAYTIRQTSYGGYIVAGETHSFGYGNAWILKLDKEGNIEWQKAYGGRGRDYVTTIQQISDGGYVVVGYTQSFGFGSYDAWVLKLDRYGNVPNCNIVTNTYANVIVTSATVTNTNALVMDTSAALTNTNAIVTNTNASVMYVCSAQTVYIQPSTTTVVSGGKLNIDIYVSDGTTKSVGVNITFDSSKVEFVGKQKYGVFSFFEILECYEGYCVYTGADPSNPVDISSPTKLGTITFRINATSGTVTFDCTKAKINDKIVDCSPVTVTVVMETWRRYDSNSDDAIGFDELMKAINDWLNGKLEFNGLMEVIAKWLKLT